MGIHSLTRRLRHTLPNGLGTESPAARLHRLRLIDEMVFELVPLSTVDDAIDALPTGATVSVTCSPKKGIAATQELAERLLGRGFAVVPHLAARRVRDRPHTRELAEWLRAAGIRRLFLVGGDAETEGAYRDGAALLDDLLECDHGLEAIGVPSYPDGHLLFSATTARDALFRKQEMLAQAGVRGWTSTQMCFDPATIAAWMVAERSAGLTLPIHLGTPGVVARAKLLTMAMRLGLGESAGYLRKNRSAAIAMMRTSNFDPDDLLVPLADDLLTHDVESLHVFTFNQVAPTEAWRQRPR